MTRQPNPKSKFSTIIVRANDECDKEIINYFKEVCARDGLEMRKEILNLIDFNWKQTHPPPGNPQLLLGKFTKQQKLSEKHKIIVNSNPKRRIIDYQSLSDVELVKAYVTAHKCIDVGASSMTAFYLKKRGIYKMAHKKL